MESFEDFLKLFLQFVFIVLIPASAVIFWIRKKFKLGFTIGLILTSLLVGVIASGSVRENPVKKFIRVINTGRALESKLALKQVVQLGEEEFFKIDEKKINNPALYAKIKVDLSREYFVLASDVLSKNKITVSDDCSSLQGITVSLNNLRHAMTLTSYAETVGGTNSELKSEISAAAADAEKQKYILENKCAEKKQ